jgi:hypothetical protein
LLIWCLFGIITMFWVMPLMVYNVVKMAVYGYLMAKHKFRQRHRENHEQEEVES